MSIELLSVDPNRDSLERLRRYYDQLATMSALHRQADEWGGCYLPEYIGAYGLVVAAVVDPGLIGFLAAKNHPGGEWVGSALYVDENYRGRGVGGMMIDEWIGRVRAGEGRSIVVNSGSMEAIRLLEARGFCERWQLRNRLEMELIIGK